MGEYDELIANLRRKAERLRIQINSSKSSVSELENMLEKCDSISNKVTSVFEDLMGNIDKKSANIPGNFISYYKNQVKNVADINHLFDVHNCSINDKNKIKNKIISYEEQISQLKHQLSCVEQDILKYQALNQSC